MSNTRELLVVAGQRVFAAHATVVIDDAGADDCVALWAALLQPTAGKSLCAWSDLPLWR